MENIANNNVNLNIDASEGEDPYSFDDITTLLNELFAVIPTTADIQGKREID